MRNWASWCDSPMKSKANFPCSVCTLRLKRKISSDCAGVSPDETRRCPLVYPGWSDLDDATGPTEDTGTSVSPLLPSGRGPLFEPGIRARSEPVVGRLGAPGANRNGGGWGRSGVAGHLHSWDLPLSAHHSFGQGHSPENPQSTDMPQFRATPHLSLVIRLGSVEHSYSDFPKSSALPAAEDTGCLRLGESFWLRFLVDESGSNPGDRCWYVRIGGNGYWRFQRTNVA